MSDTSTIQQELEEAAAALDQASTRLYNATLEFEGDTGAANWKPGPQLRWADLVGDELDRIAGEYESRDKRPPHKDVLQVRAEKAAKRRDPDLYVEFHRLRIEIDSLQKWASAKSKTISARQSVLKSEGNLASMPTPTRDGSIFGGRRAA